MSEKRLSLGINVSILVILTIFGVLLSLPLRLLLNTNYNSRDQTTNENDTAETSENVTSVETTVIPVDHRKLKRCPRFEYEDRLKSVFRSDYDGNCTYTRVSATDDSDGIDKENGSKTFDDECDEKLNISKENGDEEATENAEENGKDRRMKSIPVARHILVTMLLISAIAAVVEVLRIRFAKDKLQIQSV